MAKKKNSIEFTYIHAKNLLRIVQIFSFIYAFLLSIYWFLGLTKLPFVANIKFLFDAVVGFVNTFYKPSPNLPADADLGALVAAIIFIVIGVSAKFFYDFLSKKQELYEIKLEQQRKAEDRRQQEIIKMEYFKEMRKYDNFIMLVNFDIQKMKGHLYESQVSDESVLEMEAELKGEIFNSIPQENIRNKVEYKDGMVYFIGDIKNIALCIKAVMQAIRMFSQKYGNLDISIRHDISFDAISPNCDLTDKLEFLTKLIKLQYDNTILTTSLFKTAYEIASKTPMRFTTLGKFQIVTGKGASNIELYSIVLI